MGDTLRFYNPISYAPIGTATISSVTFPNPSVYWNLTVKLSVYPPPPPPPPPPPNTFSFIMYFNNSTKGSILPNIQVGYMVSDLAQQNSGFLIANNTLRNHRYFSFASTLFLYLFINYSFSNIYLLKSSWYADKSIQWVGRR